jgi:hypothetical protein
VDGIDDRTVGVWPAGERRGDHPLICCAVDGLGPLGHEFLDGVWPGDDVRRVRRLVARLQGAESPLIAVVDLAGAPRRLVLVQAGVAGLGHDVVAAVVAQAFAAAGERWAPVELQLAHPFADGWPDGTFPAVAEGIAGGLRSASTLERVSIDSCCLDDPGRLLGEIARTRVATTPPGMTVIEDDDGIVVARVDTPAPPRAVTGRRASIEVEVGAPLPGRRHCRPAPVQGRPAAARPEVMVSYATGYETLDLRIGCMPLDGYLPDQVRSLTDDVWWVDADDGSGPLGVVVRHPFEVDVEAPALDALWTSAPYDAPALELRGASMGLILAVAQMQLTHGCATPDRTIFEAAVAQQRSDKLYALELWREALRGGDLLAHFAVGYMAVETGSYVEAKEHLRRYTRLDPTNAWAWHWLGYACWALGDWEGAEYAFVTAIELRRIGSFDTHTALFLPRVQAREAWPGFMNL